MKKKPKTFSDSIPVVLTREEFIKRLSESIKPMSDEDKALKTPKKQEDKLDVVISKLDKIIELLSQLSSKKHENITM